MNFSKWQNLAVLVVIGAALLGGCAKKESAPAPAAAPAATPAATPAPVAPAPTAAAPAPVASAPMAAVAAVSPPTAALVSNLAPVAFKLADLKIPDFQQAPVADISSVAVQALSGLKQTLAAAAPAAPAPAAATSAAPVATAPAPSPSLTAALAKVDEVKTAVLDGKATVALEKLTQITDFVKTVPGGEAVLNTTKQLVSAWALKQGFDVAKISGVLGALQSRDYAGLATQAAGLLAKGGVSGEQKGLLNNVLTTFGIDPNNPAGAINAVKGLFGK